MPISMDHGLPVTPESRVSGRWEDIDVLILGKPDRDQLFSALGAAEKRLGRSVEAALRDADWMGSGTGPFHETLTRPMLRIPLVKD